MIKRYRSKRYGRLVVDFDRHEVLIDSLKRDRIWRDSERDYENQSYIYSEIIHELFGEESMDTIICIARWAIIALIAYLFSRM